MRITSTAEVGPVGVGGTAASGFAPGVLSSLYEVAFSTPDREVAGVFAGNPGPSGSLPGIHAVIPAAQGTGLGQAAVFGHDVWAVVHQAMARHYVGLEIVGWFISRPGHGTDPGPADLANHSASFGQPHQVLLVLDSRAHRGALYGWHEGRLFQLHEGPVERRWTRPPRPRAPIAAVTVLAVLGVLLGTVLFLLTQAAAL